MIKTRIARFAGIAAGVAMTIGFASTAGAQTMSVAQLQAQIAALMAQLQNMQGGASSASVSFTRDLTVGSSGADVTALQSWLIGKGFSISAGATGYFGAQTKAAVAKWQASAGISPAVGYFGPKSRGVVNAMGSVSGGTTTGGTVTGGTTGGTTGTITTPGVEGILTVTAGPISNTVVNVGQTMVPVLTVRAQAQRSDIDLQRITLDLGSNTAIYNKIFSKLYVVDAATGNVLSSTQLNTSTVVQSGSSYIVNLVGFHDVVSANTYKDIIVKADVNSSIDSIYLSGGASAVTNTFTVPANGVRGTDGAGIDQYGPTTLFSQTVTVNRSLIDNAQVSVSIAPATPLANQVPVTDTTNGQYLKLPVFAFNVTATNDSIHLHQIGVRFTGTASGNSGTTTTAYLYNGSTQVSSAAVSNGVATFSNITDGTAGANVPAGQTVTYTVLADVSSVTAGSLTITGSLSPVTGANVFYNSQDSTITATGTASGNTLTVLGKGPAFTLLSSTIGKTQTPSQNNNSTSTVTATFNIQVQAIGADVLFGDQASSSPMVTFGVYKGNTLTVMNVASTSSISLPSTGIVDDTSSNHTFTVPQNTTVTLPVTFLFEGRTVLGALASTDNYAVGIQSLKWVVSSTGLATATFTTGQTAWRTSTVSLP